ncbi:hypothetical protein M758_3G039500 [Ceratodon purpureus]|nr:hypothetical protein M758_3G039500 [Ceratodon purpureus]KAG0621674.1 hypothetical protein M758_3G039500 [Ceratodon purpureus]
MEQGSTSAPTGDRNGYRNYVLQPKHQIFLSHSGAQKSFVEQLCVDLERCDRHPFLDKRRESLPIGSEFPSLIFQAIEQCLVGVVILSHEFFTSKWPMLELVAMTNFKKRKPDYVIMPVLLGISLSECQDLDNHRKWLSTWRTWADSDSRIDMKDWENALKLFGPTNALKFNSDLGELKFREEIVEAICQLVPPETKLEDFHVQGRSRLCKVVREKIKQSKISLAYGVRVVGVYGVGGIGKTTICKAMCNDLSKEYRGRVAHVELESRPEDELLKDMLRRLTGTKPELIGAMNTDEYRNRLQRDMTNIGVFLAIDNASGATSKQALTLLRAKYGPGSVVLVTARSIDVLKSLRINESECIAMPELEIDEAKALFLYHAACIPNTHNEADEELISSCVQRCCFRKGGGISYHYHPLALQALGEQLGRVGYVPGKWWALLNEIDFFNPFREPEHPVFSILRKSFDALNAQDQLLFMDAALFVPYSIGGYDDFYGYKWNVFEWFGMVHGISMNTVIARLENLKSKSLLENLGDGFCRIGMHDLWREFAKLETKVGEFERRRWIFEWDEHNGLEEASLTTSGSWVNLRRMFFLERGFAKLEELNFGSFPNVTVLKLSRNDASPLQLDVSELQHLKSLELEREEVPVIFVWQRKSTTSVGLVGLGSLSKLGFLRWSNIPSDSPCIDDIGRLTNLQVLDLFGGGRLPDVSNLTLLRVACFRENDAAETITGLSSKLANLRHLDFRWCKLLHSCPGVGELVALEELRLSGCYQLKEVPNLQKLKRLRILYVNGCHLIRSLPGLGDLVNLRELDVSASKNLAEFPDMRNLIHLRMLNLQSCELIKSLPGLDELVSLQSLKTWGCINLTTLPDMQKLTNLLTLELTPDHPLQSAAGLSDLISLRTLHIGFGELQVWPNLHKLTKLEKLYIAGWQAQGFSSIENFVLLEAVSIHKCKGVRRLPDLQKLSRLRRLVFWTCEFEDMSGLSQLISLEELDIKECDRLEAIPDLRKLIRLKTMTVLLCARLRDFRGVLELRNLEVLWAGGHGWLHENIGPDLHRLTGLRVLDVSYGGFSNLDGLVALSRLESLTCRGCPIQELPDLSKFPNLMSLNVRDCVNLTKLPGRLSPKFSLLDVQGCTSLTALPYFSYSRFMREIHVANCGIEITPRWIQLVKARWPNVHLVTELPAQPQNPVTTLEANVAGGAGDSADEQFSGVEAREPLSASSLLFSLVRCCSNSE